MKIMTPVLAAAMLWPAAVHAQTADYHEELIEWVIAPCMEVAAALGVKEYKAESIEMGIKRAHIAKLMVASRDASTRKLAAKMKASATWEARRAAYPIMLKLCLGNLPGMK